MFTLSSGLMFNAKFRENYLAVGAASIIAFASSYFLFEALSKRFGQIPSSSTASTPPPRAWNSEGDDIFTANDLAMLAGPAGAHVCEAGCYLPKYNLLRLPLRDVEGERRRAFLVTQTDTPSCAGSGGCMTAVMIWQEEKMYVIEEGFGISDRQAMLIAREALTSRPK